MCSLTNGKSKSLTFLICQAARGGCTLELHVALESHSLDTADLDTETAVPMANPATTTRARPAPAPLRSSAPASGNRSQAQPVSSAQVDKDEDEEKHEAALLLQGAWRGRVSRLMARREDLRRRRDAEAASSALRPRGSAAARKAAVLAPGQRSAAFGGVTTAGFLPSTRRPALWVRDRHELGLGSRHLCCLSSGKFVALKNISHTKKRLPT